MKIRSAGSQSCSVQTYKPTDMTTLNSFIFEILRTRLQIFSLPLKRHRIASEPRPLGLGSGLGSVANCSQTYSDLTQAYIHSAKQAGYNKSNTVFPYNSNHKA